MIIYKQTIKSIRKKNKNEISFFLLGVAAILTNKLLIKGSILTLLDLTAIIAAISPNNNSQKNLDTGQAKSIIPERLKFK